MTTTDSAICGKPNDYFNGSEISGITGTGAAQTRRVDDFAVVAGVATFTVATWTSPAADTVFEVHHVAGRGFLKANYDAAIDRACDALADYEGSDTDNISLAIERGQTNGGSALQGFWRDEYPFPSGFNWLNGVDILSPMPCQTHGTGNLSAFRAMGDASARTRLSQGVQVQQSTMVSYIAFYMAKFGTPTDSLTCVVEGNSSGLPDGVAVTNGTSDTVDGSTLQERGRYQVFTFDPPMLWTQGTTYQVTVKRSTAVNASNYYLVGEDGNALYSYGALGLYNASWSAASPASDLIFSISQPGRQWVPLARIFYDYQGGAVDTLKLRTRGLGLMAYEGTPLRLRGVAAIARPTAESSTININPAWVLAFCVSQLERGGVGIQGPDNLAAGSAAWAQSMGLVPSPVRPAAHGAIKIR